MAEPRPKPGEPLGPLEIALTPERIHAYAGASGDHNPIHVDAAFAATTPFGGPIAHGMLLLAYLSRLLSDRFGAAWPESGRLEARFRAPAMVGSSLIARGTVQEVEDTAEALRVICELRCEAQNGEALVTATAWLTLPGSRGRGSSREGSQLGP